RRTKDFAGRPRLDSVDRRSSGSGARRDLGVGSAEPTPIARDMAKKKGPRDDNGPAARERGGFKTSRHGTGKKASAGGPKAAQKRAAEERESAGHRHTAHETSRYLRGDRIEPRPIDG